MFVISHKPHGDQESKSFCHSSCTLTGSELLLTTQNSLLLWSRWEPQNHWVITLSNVSESWRKATLDSVCLDNLSLSSLVCSMLGTGLSHMLFKSALTFFHSLEFFLCNTPYATWQVSSRHSVAESYYCWMRGTENSAHNTGWVSEHYLHGWSNTKAGFAQQCQSIESLARQSKLYRYSTRTALFQKDLMMQLDFSKSCPWTKTV